MGSPSHRARVFAAVRFVSSEGRLRIDGWQVGRGRLLPGGARAGDQGLTVAVDRGTPELVPLPPSTLRRGPGAERACF